MLTTTILIALIISLIAIAYVAWPLLRSGATTAQLPDDDKLLDLVARKDTILRSIKELEFDYHMGKLSAEDFERFNQRLRQQAVGLLRQIEKVAPNMADLEQQLEAAIAQRRTVTSGVITAEINGRSHDAVLMNEKFSSTFCPACHAPVAVNANFCANCGAEVAKLDVPADS